MSVETSLYLMLRNIKLINSMLKLTIMKIATTIIPKYEIDNMLQTTERMMLDNDKSYADLQRAICNPLLNCLDVIDQVIRSYEQQILDIIPKLLEKCEDLRRLDLITAQTEQINYIEDYLHAVTKNNKAIIVHAKKLRMQMTLELH